MKDSANKFSQCAERIELSRYLSMNEKKLTYLSLPIKRLFSELSKRFSPKSDSVKSMAVITFGTVGGQAIVLIALPILTRLYTPEEFGALAVYAAVIGILSMVSSLRYELAIPLPAKDEDAINVLSIALFSVFCLAFLIGFIVIIFGNRISIWINFPILKPYLWLFPLGVALSGSYKVFNYWAIRDKSFLVIARTKLKQGGAAILIQVTTGFAHFGIFGLLLGHIIGQAAGISNLIRNSLSESYSPYKHISFSKAIELARRFRRFPIFSAPSAVVQSLGAQLPLLLFAALFSPSIAGLYFLAERNAKMPVRLLSQAVNQVFLSEAAKAQRTVRLNVVSLRTYQGLLRICVSPFLLFGVITPELFKLIFGSEWIAAGYYIQLLIPMLIAIIIFSPVQSLFAVLEQQKASLVFQLTVLSFRVTGLIIGAKIGGIYTSILFYSIGSIIVYISFGFWLYGLAGVRTIDLFISTLSEILIALPILLILYLMKFFLYSVNPDTFNLNTTIMTLITLFFILLCAFFRLRYLFQRNQVYSS